MSSFAKNSRGSRIDPKLLFGDDREHLPGRSEGAEKPQRRGGLGDSLLLLGVRRLGLGRGRALAGRDEALEQDGRAARGAEAVGVARQCGGSQGGTTSWVCV